MITLINSSNETVYQIKCDSQKVISTALKFSADTIRWLQASLEITAETANIYSNLDLEKIAGKTVESITKDLQNSPNLEKDAKEYINLAQKTLGIQKNKMELIIELAKILGLEEEQEKGYLQMVDMFKIYELVKNDPASNIPLT
jgi:hypothetical protein